MQKNFQQKTMTLNFSSPQPRLGQILKRFSNIFAAAGHPSCVFKIKYIQLIKITNASEKDISE